MTIAIDIAKQCGIAYYLTPENTCEMHGTDRQIEAFAESIRALEREACAKVCEELRHPFGWSAETEDWTGATDNCAAAIRARAIQWDEARIDVIGPNGNDGLHYDQEK